MTLPEDGITTVSGTATRTPGKRGRLPADLSRPHVRVGAHLQRGVPPNPAVVDWASRVTEWPMYGNDRLGDCAWAMAGHLVEAWSTYGEGSTVELSLEELLAGYSAVTGFDPNQTQPDGSNPTDQGTVLVDEFAFWRRTGIGAHRILAYARVDHEDMSEVEAALNVFGGLAVGVRLPAAAEQQFADHQPWDLVPNDGGILGGHAIHVAGYDTKAGMLPAITWGSKQLLTEAWWGAYVDECWAIISPEWLSAAGTSPAGLDLHGLGADFAALTGEPNPFPTPAPNPKPAPHDGHTVIAEFEAAVERLLTWLKSHL